MSDIEQLEANLDAGDGLEDMTALEVIRVIMRKSARVGDKGNTMRMLQRLAKYRRVGEIRDDLRGVLPEDQIDELMDAVRPVPIP